MLEPTIYRHTVHTHIYICIYIYTLYIYTLVFGVYCTCPKGARILTVLRARMRRPPAASLDHEQSTGTCPDPSSGKLEPCPPKEIVCIHKDICRDIYVYIDTHMYMQHVSLTWYAYSSVQCMNRDRWTCTRTYVRGCMCLLRCVPSSQHPGLADVVSVPTALLQLLYPPPQPTQVPSDYLRLA